MKNVRLFAVAAALGMFASTVAAAETTKTVTWSGDDTVIKVDLGEKLVVTAPTASIKIEGTEAECQNGTDANGDGLVDAEVYGLNPEVFENGWYPSTTLWSSSEAAVKAITLGGARYLTPGEAEVEEETYVDVATGVTYYSNEDFFAALVKKGEVVVTYNEDDEIATATIKHFNTYENAYKTYKTGEVWTTLVSEGKKKSDAAIMEAVIENLVNGTAITNTNEFTVGTYENPVFDNKNVDTYSIIVNSVQGGHAITNSQSYYTNYGGSPIVTVSYSNRKGYEFENVDFANVSAGETTNSVILGESRYHYSKTAFATPTDLNVKEDIVAGNVYIDSTDSYSFTAGELIWLEVTSKNTDKVYSKTHLYAVDGDVVDGIVIRKPNAYGFMKDTVVDYTTADISVKYNGTWTKVTAKNAKTLWTVENLVDGNVIINGTQIDTFEEELTAGTAGVALITELEVPFDYVSAGQGLNVTSKRNASLWTTATWGAYGVFVDVEEEVYEAGKVANPDFNSLTRLGKAGYVTVVDVTDAEEIYSEDKEGNRTYDVDGVSVVAQYPISTFEDGEQAMDYYLSINEDGELVFGPQIQALTLDTTHNDATSGSYLAYGEVSENSSDKYVLLTDASGSGVGFAGLSFSYNSNKETGVLYTYDNEVIECSAVELDDDKWYPAFDTEEELLDAVAKLAGVEEALEGTATKAGTSFYKWYNANVADYPAAVNFLPTTANYVGKDAEACDYTVTSNSDKVTVTQVNSIDTTVAGVYDLEFSATFEGEVVDTTSIKVVVAPNYTRTWENGRVKTLTSYYVNKPTAKYAEYNYDWAAGTATVTYYTVDGAVADTATINL